MIGRSGLMPLLAEAKRRRVFRAAGAYAIVAFLVVQVADLSFPALHLPSWTVTFVVALAILGLPVVVAVAWAFDITPQGLERTAALDPGDRVGRDRGEPGTGGQEAAGAPAAEPGPRERWERVNRILAGAIEQPAADLERYLDRACGPDQELRLEVESLVAAHRASGPLDRLGRDIEPLLRPLRPAPTPPDRYEIIDRLGGGGMGVVYRARDLRLARTVALKFLPPHRLADPEAKRRFVFEAQAAAGLDHPNICTIHEIGETADGRMYIAMPFYDGVTLERRLARGTLPLSEALEIVIQIAQGLAKAHEAGIVHRDIKPANVMLTDESVVKVLDFGIAKLAGDDPTVDGAVVGTVAYMSPEQARAEPLDHRTDLWSLGVVFHEMLTGERPFRGAGADAVLAAIRSDDPVRLGRLRGSAPAAVVDIVERLLTKPVESRAASAAALSRELREIAAAGGAALARDVDDTADTLAPEGERRQVAVVAGTLVGYSTLVERLEATALDARLARLRSAVESVSTRHGGTLNQFTGDDFVIVFGVPVTHEDDVARALRAATELRDLDDLGAEETGDEPLSVRTGVSTGTVVAQRLESGDRRFRLAGAPPRIAAGLAAHAQPGEVLVDGRGERAVRDRFRVTPRDPVPAASGDEPITAFVVHGETDAHARIESTDPDLLTAFTGRDRELATLRSLLDRVLAGDGQVATVVGEAGAGKSRLVHEFRRRLDPRAIRWVRGQCSASAGRRPYAPFIDALLDTLGLERDLLAARPSARGPAESAPARREDETRDLEARVADAVLGIDPELEEFLPFYLHLLSVPARRHPLPRHLEGEQFRAAVREALTALLTSAATVAPLALLLEDWHWVDEASHEALQQLADMVASYPLLVVVTYRPGDGDPWTGSQPRTLLHLAPLGIEESGIMIRRMLGARALDDGVAATLHERSGGNPFFIEELCQALGEHGLLRLEDGRARLTGPAGELHLPTTIQGVIRTRLDRLPHETREVLRVAAVVGRQFTLPVLERMGLDTATLRLSLDRLKSLALVQQIRLVPEPVYRFKHVLTQEVAYDTLLQHQRSAYHARAGRALEELYPDRLDELADRLAHHFSNAEDWRRAVQYGRASARHARELSEFPEALSLLERVESWLERLPADDRRRRAQVEILLEQEQLCETLGLRARQQELITRVSAILDHEADRELLAEVHRRQGDIYTLLRRFGEAGAALDTALRLVEETGDVDRHVAVLRSLGLMCWHEGRHADALAHLRRALAIDRERDEVGAVLGDLHNIGQILKSDGDVDGALATLTEALELTDRAGNEIKKAYILHNIANIHRALGDPDRALEYFEAAAELTARKHLPIQRSFHLTSMAHVHLAEGRTEESLRLYREAVDVARRARYAEGLAFSLRVLGEVLAGLGRDAEALPYLLEAAELYAQLGPANAEMELWKKAAAAHERMGDYERALDAWAQVRNLADRTDGTAAVVQSLEARARCLRQVQPDGAAAAAALEEALALARDAGERAVEARILNTLGIIEWTRGGYRAALAHYEAALAAFREMGDDVHAGLALNSLGVTLREMGRTAEARRYLQEAIELNRRTGERLLEGHGLAALAELHQDAGELEEARSCLEASLEIRRDVGDARGESWMLYSLAALHSRAGEDALARDRLSAARRMAAEREDVELLRACSEVQV